MANNSNNSKPSPRRRLPSSKSLASAPSAPSVSSRRIIRATIHSSSLPPLHLPKVPSACLFLLLLAVAAIISTIIPTVDATHATPTTTTTTLLPSSSRGGGTRHWMSLIPPSRLASLTLDDAEIILEKQMDMEMAANTVGTVGGTEHFFLVDPRLEGHPMTYTTTGSGRDFNYGLAKPEHYKPWYVEQPWFEEVETFDDEVEVETVTAADDDVDKEESPAVSEEEEAGSTGPTGPAPTIPAPAPSSVAAPAIPAQAPTIPTPTPGSWVDPPGFPVYPIQPSTSPLNPFFDNEGYFDYTPGYICPGQSATTSASAATISSAASAAPTPTPPGVLTYVGDEDELQERDITLQRCEGDCDQDSDCENGLECWQRTSDDDDPIPGCTGEFDGGADYCYNPNDNDDDDDDDGDDDDDEEDNDEDNHDGCYGPQSWHQVTASSTPASNYWSDFSEWIEPSLNRNFCDGTGQSPINIRYQDARAECLEYHKIRHKMGDYGVEHPLVDKQILPNKLRLVYPRDYDEDMYEDGIGGPSADMPKGWGHQLPVTNVDIKIPSEHWLEDKQYAAEYQIFLIQDRDAQRGAPAVSVLIDLHPQDVPNRPLQRALDEFQAVFDADLADCQGFRRRHERRRQKILEAAAASGFTDSDSLVDKQDEYEEEDDDEAFELRRRNLRRRAQDVRLWDPWHKDIIRSNYFFGYEGSLTEPPCTEFISWRVIDYPAYVSRNQLLQMKRLLFEHVDDQCRLTSNGHGGSVARPPQPLNGRDLWQCTCRDFIGDDERDWYGRNRCWESDEHVFHEISPAGTLLANPDTKPEMTSDAVWNCQNRPDMEPPCCGSTFDPYHACCARDNCRL